jgi:hypothetical protein
VFSKTPLNRPGRSKGKRLLNLDAGLESWDVGRS